MLTSFVKIGRITTTPKKAKVLKAETDAFFSKLVNTYTRYTDEKESTRECIRLVKATIFGETE
jgi:ribosomal protein L17